MEVFGIFGASTACYHFAESCHQAWDTIRLARRVELLLSDFYMEETIYGAYRNHFSRLVGLKTGSGRCVQQDLWCNASIRTVLEINLGANKAHALLENLRETEDSIKDIYRISSAASQVRRIRVSSIVSLLLLR
jgi:hypothetical protein